MIQVHMEELQVTPRVTALLVTRNSVNALSGFLSTLAEGPDPDAAEILVVDNGSTDGTASLDQEYPQATFLRLPRFFGRTKALNIGIRTAKGEFLLLVEPWMRMTGQQINQLADMLSSHLDVVAVAPVTVDANGSRVIRIHELPDAATLNAAWKQGGDWPGRPAPTTPAVLPVAAVSRAPLLVRKEFIRGMNFFDERYGEFGSMWELFYQIQRAGRKLVVTQDIVARAERTPEWGSLPASPEKAMFSVDFASGAAAYLGKRAGAGKAIGFRLSAAMSALGQMLSFRSPGYASKVLMGLVTGQKIDGTQG